MSLALEQIKSAKKVHVLEVDEGKQSLTVLPPCPGNLPSKFLLLASLKWIEK